MTRPNRGNNIADLRRLAQRNRKQRNWQSSTFPTSTAGLVRPPSPIKRDDNTPSSSGVGSIVIGQDNPPIGELIRCDISGTLGSGGARPNFVSALIQNGFAGAILPSSQLLLPHTAVYGVEGMLRWADGYTGGGTVSLEIDASEWIELSINDQWNRVSIAEEFIANRNQFLSFNVNHSDTVDHELEGFLTVAVKEPLRDTFPTCDEIIAGLGPLGWWELDETAGTTAEDRSGNSHDGTYVGGFTLDQAALCCGDASVDLDGQTGSHVDLSDPSVFNFAASDYSIVACINIDGDSAGSKQVIASCSDRDSIKDWWIFYATDTDPYDLVLWSRNSSGPSSQTISAGASLDRGTTYHVAVVEELSGFGLSGFYINGEFTPGGIVASATPDVFANPKAYIGATDDLSSSSQDSLHGRISNVQIYDKALTQDQITSLYTSSGV